MKIVITGGIGFIGQNLARYLKVCRPEWELVAVDWFEGALPEEKANYDQVITSCFTSPQAMQSYHGADAVIHLAAYTTVQESIKDPARSYDNNVFKTLKLLEFLRSNEPEAHFIFASTGGAIIGDYNGAIHEEIVAKPLSPYGASKLAVEALLSSYRGSYGMKSVSLRFSNVYGPYSFRKSSVIAAFCKMYLDSGKLQINGDGLQTRDYIYVKDVCEAICLCISKGGEGVFQLGTGIPTSINEVIKIFREIASDNAIEFIHAPALSGEVRHNQADISKIRSELGFLPSHSLRDGMLETLSWFKSREIGKDEIKHEENT